MRDSFGNSTRSLTFHKRVLSHATFVEGMVDTRFVERTFLESTA